MCTCDTCARVAHVLHVHMCYMCTCVAQHMCKNIKKLIEQHFQNVAHQLFDVYIQLSSSNCPLSCCALTLRFASLNIHVLHTCVTRDTTCYTCVTCDMRHMCHVCHVSRVSRVTCVTCHVCHVSRVTCAHVTLCTCDTTTRRHLCDQFLVQS